MNRRTMGISKHLIVIMYANKILLAPLNSYSLIMQGMVYAMGAIQCAYLDILAVGLKAI
jgi:hypothetical protein